MKVGARNQLVGEVVEIQKGMLMAKAKFKIPADSTMASVMTLESLEDLGLKKGDKVRLFIKAINVLVVKE
ncbi:MAG: TOBE domain-containing protein [Candidatus Eisenbacteria bacterium]|nr:TOBE domain-containing protein [Candidatus Eisenbacteria bacterium]